MIICQACNSNDTKVTNTNANGQRRRCCNGCGHVFYTQELIIAKTLRPRRPPVDKRSRPPSATHTTSIDLSLFGVWK